MAAGEITATRNREALPIVNASLPSRSRSDSESGPALSRSPNWALHFVAGLSLEQLMKSPSDSPQPSGYTASTARSAPACTTTPVQAP